MPGLDIQTKTGKAVQAGDYTLEPVSQSISWIGKQAGAVWNRPYAIRVERRGVVQEVPIRDVTRIALVLLWGLTALFSIFTLKSYIKRRKTDE